MRTISSILIVLMVVLAGCGEAPEKPWEKIPTSIEQIFSDYAANGVCAKEQYEGKILVITGQVTNIGTTFGDAFVEINDSMHCFVEDEKTVAYMNKGQTVTVQGRCDGKPLIDVVLSKCTVK